MATKRKRPIPLLEHVYGGRKPAREARAELAGSLGVDEETVLQWAVGEETPPDDVLTEMLEEAGASIAFLMNWQNAPRGAIPEQWRRALAEDNAARAEYSLAGEFDHLLELIEQRLRADPDLPEPESDIVPRLQRLRAAILEYLAEPLEAVA